MSATSQGGASPGWWRSAPSVIAPLALALIGSAVMMGTVLVGPERARAGTLVLDDGEAIALLRRAERAPAITRYRGRELVSVSTTAGIRTAVVDVDHVPDDVRDTFPTFRHTTLVARKYELTVGGTAFVVGRSTELVEARRTSGTPAARWWVDRETGLVLRQEAYDRSGSLMRSSTFLRLDVLATGLNARPVSNSVASYRSDPGNSVLTRLRADGWVCPELLGPGLRLQVAREIPGQHAVQLTYSDGLMSVSVFEQRGRLDTASLSGYERRSMDNGVVYAAAGLPSRLLWQSSGRIFTVVADAPPEMVAEVVSALPPPDRPAPETFFDKVRRGLARVGAWFNSFV